MKIEFVNETTSTNDDLISRAKGGYSEDVMLVAFSQTKGKGRMGRQFYSPSKSGLYVSFLVHPKVQMEDAFKLTTMVAVAAAEAVWEISGEDIKIKWVNDLYRNNKKISGILTECSPQIVDGIPEFLVAGIGINLYSPEGGFPDDIKDKAGAVFEEELSGVSGERLEEIKKNLAYRLLEKFEKYYSSFPDVNYLEAYRKKSMLDGKDVFILDGPRVHVDGISDNFELMVTHQDGTKENIRAGEVSLIL